MYIGDKPKSKEWKKLLDTNSTIQRYSITWGEKYLKYGDWLWCPRDSKFFEEPKILFVRLRNKSLSRKLIGMLDNDKYYNRDNFNNIIIKDARYSLAYILGLFNSNLLNYWYKSYFDNVNINPAQVRLLPYPKINFSDSADKSRHDHIVKLVEQMLSAKEKLASAKLESEKDRLELLCQSLDRQIDEAVYELYDLTAEEIKVVEGEK
ncbi:hypothetical protein JNM05_08730 [bacterium]|nr:hypothetical protein [bacterium]